MEIMGDLPISLIIVESGIIILGCIKNPQSYISYAFQKFYKFLIPGI